MSEPIRVGDTVEVEHNGMRCRAIVSEIEAEDASNHVFDALGGNAKTLFAARITMRPETDGPIVPADGRRSSGPRAAIGRLAGKYRRSSRRP